MKTCIKCGTTYENPAEHFSPKKNARDGFHPYCRQCKAAAQRMSRVLHPDCDKDYYRRNPEKRKSYVRVQRAIVSGQLQPPTALLCAIAGCTRVANQYHHLDYERESRIAPVCKVCHSQLKAGDAAERDLTTTYKITLQRRRKKHSNIYL